MLFDFHIHSIYSYDSLNKIEDILKTAKKKGLSGLAITDHEKFEGSIKAFQIAKEYDILVIPGMEINTDEGDIIALFIKNEIVSRKFQSAVKEIKNQGGIVVMPHPYKKRRVIQNRLIDVIDIIEIYNSRGESLGEKFCNKRAQELAIQKGKPIIAGSDAHFLFELARGCIDLGTVENLDDVKKKLLLGSNNVIVNKESSKFLEVFSQFIKSSKLRDIKVFISALRRLFRTIKVEIFKKYLRKIYNKTLYPFVKKDNVAIVRQSVRDFLYYCNINIELKAPILDIGPQKNSYSTNLFSKEYKYYTLDIDHSSNPDIVADITNMPHIKSERFGTIICTEVLEHVRNPFKAVSELYRVLKKGGFLLVTTPFNLRIHGPKPDCWRFTEEGLKELFTYKFEIIDLQVVRPLIRKSMPIHYRVILKKN